ncbi:MAG: copper amine oxidase N-terminal domain-containing protein, partial [Defluviitaleaceae bacterium]|nr:copper amine oxidase N-terminal domain-containing protein [Defluviitaleaceae bacterium]
MKKVKTVVVALVLAVIMAMPVTVTASAFVDVESTVAVDEDSAYAPLRLVAYAYGAAVEWDSANREAVITRADGYVILIPVEAVGGFIENGVAWVPMDFVYDVLVGLLTIETAPARVERIDLTLWNAENFEDTRDPMFSTDEPMGVIATGFIEYMSDNLGARSAFTYRELEAAVWIVEELLAMGHDWDNIAIQEFTYWQVHDMGLQTFG